MPTLKEQYLAMNEANRFLLEHCEKVLQEIRKAYQGVSHSVNRCNAEYADCYQEQKALGERIDSQAKELTEVSAAIGKLQEQAAAFAATETIQQKVAAMEERQEKMATWLREKFGKKDSTAAEAAGGE